MQYHNITHSLSTQPCFGHLLNEKLLELAKLLHVGSRRSEMRNASLAKIMSVLVQNDSNIHEQVVQSPINVSDKKLARKRDRSKVIRAHLYDRLSIKRYGSPVDHCEYHRHNGCDGPNSRGVEQHLQCEQ